MGLIESKENESQLIAANFELTMHQKILYQHWQQQQLQQQQEKQTEQEEEWEENMSVERTPSPYLSDMSTNSGSDNEHTDNYNFHVLSAPENDSQNDKKRHPLQSTAQGHKIQLTKEMIEQHLKYPQKVAAQMLGVSITTLKRRFNELLGSDKRWPYYKTTSKTFKSKLRDLKKEATSYSGYLAQFAPSSLQNNNIAEYLPEDAPEDEEVVQEQLASLTTKRTKGSLSPVQGIQKQRKTKSVSPIASPTMMIKNRSSGDLKELLNEKEAQDCKLVDENTLKMLQSVF